MDVTPTIAQRSDANNLNESVMALLETKRNRLGPASYTRLAVVIILETKSKAHSVYLLLAMWQLIGSGYRRILRYGKALGGAVGIFPVE